MEFKKNTRNELMKRQEISFLILDKKNPGFEEMKKKISGEMKKPEECIDVYNVEGKFGRDSFLVKAYIYDSKKELEAIKTLSKTKKQKKAEIAAAEEEKKKQAEAKAAKAAENAKEDAKE